MNRDVPLNEQVFMTSFVRLLRVASAFGKNNDEIVVKHPEAGSEPARCGGFVASQEARLIPTSASIAKNLEQRQSVWMKEKRM